MNRRNFFRGALAALVVATLPRVLLPKPSTHKMIITWDPAVREDVAMYQVWYRPTGEEIWHLYRQEQLLEVSRAMGIPQRPLAA